MQIRALPHHKFRIAFDRSAASWAHTARARHEIERHRIGRPLAHYDLKHRGNHLPRFLDNHRIAHPDILATNLVLVVQSGARDSATAQVHRLQIGDGRHYTSASDLEQYCAQDGLGLFGDELVGAGPTGSSGSKPSFFSQRNLVELNHCPIGLKTEVIAHTVQLVNCRHDLLGVPAQPREVWDTKAQTLQPTQQGLLRGGAIFWRGTNAIEHDFQRAFCHNLWVQQLQRTSSSVARIRKRSFPRSKHLLTGARKACQRHINFATHFHLSRRSL